MKVLVTGGAGFIGANLCRFLLERGIGVRVLDILTYGAGRLSGLDVDLVTGDICDASAVSRALRGCDGVVHLAAESGVQQSLEDPVGNFHVNVGGLLTVLEACRQLQNSRTAEGDAQPFRFVMASSNAAIGRQPPPADETVAPLPISPYGACKLAGEGLCMAYYGSYRLSTVALRFGNAYGPYSDHKESVVAKFMKDLRHTGRVQIDGDGLQTRDFIHTDDMCAAMYRALVAPVGGEIFQIASGVETSIRELATLLESVAGVSVERQFGAPRNGDMARNFSDIGKAKRLLDWQPGVSLEDGMARLWAWYDGR